MNKINCRKIKSSWNTEKLINVWQKFWTSKDHLQVPNFSIINKDHSLLFVNSGVAALKPYFLGQKIPPHKRLFNVQSVIRTNDISIIGTTNRHLTFFQMLGNFSFNDYQKKESLTWGWEFLTSPKWLNLNSQKLYVTFLASDQETKKILLSLGIKDDHLISGDQKSNFWDLGVGPCGPNVEFFYDLGVECDPQNRGIFLLEQNIDNDRYLEIWNIVFSYQINFGNQKYVLSPQKNIDTGAGLERLLTVLNQHKNPFMLQEYQKIIEKLNISPLIINKIFTQNKLTISENQIKKEVQIICDHLRAIGYCLNALLQEKKNLDFQTSHGYVVRKLIRNASLQGYFLNYRKPFLFELLFLILQEKTFQENCHTIKSDQILIIIKQILWKEEQLFWKIITSKTVQKLLQTSKNTVLKGLQIFKLVSEKGVPLSLIKSISKKNNFELQLLEFQELWNHHLQKSGHQKFIYLQKWELLTSKKNNKTIFDDNNFMIKNLPICDLFVDQKRVSKVESGKCWIIFDKTPFFVSKGGQTSDSGSIYRNNQKIGNVLDVKLNQLSQILHYVEVLVPFSINDKITLKIDLEKRLNTCKNHSATHLLHSRLIKNLQDQKLTVRQNGSFNNDQYLRLDILCFQKEITEIQLSNIEDQVNHLISLNIEPKISWTTETKAKKMNALVFFDVQKFQKNGQVRVVNFENHSIELCGGTHVKNTKDIEKFLIFKVKKIGKNNFRFYALTSAKKITAFWNHYLKNSFLNNNKLKSLIPLSSETQKIWNNLQILIKNEHHFLTFVAQEKLLKKKLQKLQANNINQKKHFAVEKYYLQQKHFYPLFQNKSFLSVHYLFFENDFIENKRLFFWDVFDQAFQKRALSLFLFMKINDHQLFFVFEETITSFLKKNDLSFTISDCQKLQKNLNDYLKSFNDQNYCVFNHDHKRKQRWYGKIYFVDQKFNLSKLQSHLDLFFKKLWKAKEIK